MLILEDDLEPGAENSSTADGAALNETALERSQEGRQAAAESQGGQVAQAEESEVVVNEGEDEEKLEAINASEDRKISVAEKAAADAANSGETQSVGETNEQGHPIGYLNRPLPGNEVARARPAAELEQEEVTRPTKRARKTPKD